MLEHGVDRMEQLEGDHDEGLLGLLALRFLAEVDSTPLGAAMDCVNGREIEGMARGPRADCRRPRPASGQTLTVPSFF